MPSSSSKSQFKGATYTPECVDFAGIEVALAKMNHWAGSDSLCTAPN